ncbi:MAG: transporter substrate-binding domain-containing protein [Coriobacteriales bacterium]|jgi:polar amino acid transport system substrate-binding protein|nr:transporter substrate-binding domain-containing protein [Coriobacteriales bacterium]
MSNNAHKSCSTSHRVASWRHVLALLLAGALLVLSSGCAAITGSKELKLEPQVSTPTIATEGVLKIGVDSSHAPFAGISKGKLVGIDVDIASTLALQLGLKAELVDIAGKSADTLLNNQDVDIVMDVEQTGGSIIQGIQVGPYLQSGPALFSIIKSNTVPTVDTRTMAGIKIAAQNNSLSAWALDELVGKGTADPKNSLEQVFESVADGTVTYGAADAIVGSYLALDYADIACIKMLGTPIGVYIGVGKNNSSLAEPLTVALRTIRDNGELEIVLAKWLGRVSAQVVMGSQAVVSQDTTNPAVSLPEGEIDTGEDLPDPANAGGV